MDVWLLGAAAIVLVAITVWIVWPTKTVDPSGSSASALPPQGDRFEDQYTSATADLSAGGVAEAFAESGAGQRPVATEQAAAASQPPATSQMPRGSDQAPWPSAPAADRRPDVSQTRGARPRTVYSQVAHEPTPRQAQGEPWSSATAAREEVGIELAGPTSIVPIHAQPETNQRTRTNVSVGAAALLTVGGAVGGAVLYARWQRQRHAPLNRLRRALVAFLR